MNEQTLSVATPEHQAMVEITRQVQDAVAALKLTDGIVHCYARHTTCGLIINENADPNVARDLIRRLSDLVPWDDPRDRHASGNTAAHLRTVLVGPSVTVPVVAGRLSLGTWQGVFLAEFDGPRTRQVTVTPLRPE